MNADFWNSQLDRINVLLTQRGLDKANPAGPASQASIQAVEEKLQVTFPPDYREFLQTYGALEVDGSSIFGIWDFDPLSIGAESVLGETLRMREAGMDKRFIAIRSMGYSQNLCLDTAATEGMRLKFYSASQQAFFPCEWAPDFAAYFALFLDEILNSL